MNLRHPHRVKLAEERLSLLDQLEAASPAEAARVKARLRRVEAAIKLWDKS